LNRVTVVAELHPSGWSGIGDPLRCLKLLENSGAGLCDIRGARLSGANDSDFTQVCAVWPSS
jgi:hypothetical protein